MAKSPSSMVQSISTFLGEITMFHGDFFKPWISHGFHYHFPLLETAISQESSEERWLEERQAREAQVQGLEDPESC